MRGYLNALMVLSFFVSEREAVTTNCKVKSGSNLTMTLDQSSMNVHRVSLSKGEKEIASSTSLSVGWDDFLDKKYEHRLILNATGNMTVHLHRVIVDDEGNYTTIVFLENGSSLKKYWNIKLEDFTEPEVIGKFTISVTKDNGKFHCRCGEFKDDTIPQLSFKWNISNYKDHALNCTGNVSASCTVTWPVSECQDIIYTWTAEHRVSGNRKEVPNGDGLSVGAVGVIVASVIVIVIVIVIIVVILIVILKRKRKHRHNNDPKDACVDTVIPLNPQM